MAKTAPKKRATVIEHERVQINFHKPSRTRQEFKEECNINTILKTFKTTGALPHMNRRQPQFLDTSEIPDLQTAMQIMIDADRVFMSLPATVRKTFDNDPVKFVEFAENEENLDQMREWGLAPPKTPEAAPQRVEIVKQPEDTPPADPKTQT